MEDITVSMTDGRKEFRRLLQAVLNNKEKIIITKGRTPVAAIIPYDEYQRSMRVEGYNKIMKFRKAFLKARFNPENIYKESKDQLEVRPCRMPF